MDKDTILKQLKSVPNYSFFMIRGTEMAKDLKDLLKDNETIQGFTEIFEKNIGMVFSNNARNGLRSYLVITDKNLYFIRRGRLNLNLITGLDKTLVIPLRDIVKITLDKVSEDAFKDIEEIVNSVCAENNICSRLAYGVGIHDGMELYKELQTIDEVGGKIK